MFEIMDSETQEAVIKVIGVGGCGGNAVEHMIEKNVGGVEFICANTDMQALKKSQAKTVLQIGMDITKGLGAGAKPEIGREAALEDRDRIAEAIDGADMLFITAGMGGGTGTGAAPIIAEVAKEMGILTVAVVTKPFAFEGKRSKVAVDGLEELSKHVDSLIIIPNEKLMTELDQEISMREAFTAVDNVLFGAISGITEVIKTPGIISVDFADVRTVMTGKGLAMMGSGSAKGENRARNATEMAIYSPLLDNVALDGAKGVLVNISSAIGTLKMKEYHEIIRLAQITCSQRVGAPVTAVGYQFKHFCVDCTTSNIPKQHLSISQKQLSLLQILKIYLRTVKRCLLDWKIYERKTMAALAATSRRSFRATASAGR